MASIWTRLFNRKQSAARTALAFNQVGQPVSTPRNYEAFSKEGYQINVIAYKCVSILSRSCGSIKWNLYTKPRAGMSDPVEIVSHPLIDLLQKPNPMQGQSSFTESVIAYYLISGNSYIEAVLPTPNAAPMELWSLRPDKMKIIPGPIGLPMAFEFTASSKKIIFPVDQITGASNILHMKTFHPTDNWYGMSSIESALYSIDQHNESGKWNTSLLQNQGAPSGVITIKQDASNPLGLLPDTQFENMKETIRQNLEGASNAGRTLLLEGGMDWKQMGLSPKEMDWIEGRKMASRDIALAFGVPPIILNIPGDSTFNNYKEARLSLYEDTILPMMDNLQDELNKWLVPRFGDNLFLKYNSDTIPALDAKRSEKFTLISGAGFLSINEKRAAVGYSPVDDGDIILVNSGQVSLDDFADVAEDETLEKIPEETQNGETTEQDDNAGSEDVSNETDNETDDSLLDDSDKHLSQVTEFKQINPLGLKDRRRVWKQINKERDRLSNALYLDLKEAFDSMADALGESVDGVEPRLAEFAALKTISDFSPKFKEILLRHFKRFLRHFGEPLLESGKSLSPHHFETKTRVRFNDFINRYAETHTAESITQIENTNMKKARSKIKKIVAESIDAGESVPNLRNELRKEFSALSSSRAEMIARTEVGMASNNGALEAAKALDIPDLKKEWVSVNDDRTRDGSSNGEADHVSLNGVKVNIDEKFLQEIQGYSPVEMDGPGDPAGGPESTINCRCVLTFGRG